MLFLCMYLPYGLFGALVSTKHIFVFLYGLTMDFVAFLYGLKNLLLIFFAFLYDYTKDFFGVNEWTYHGLFQF